MLLKIGYFCAFSVNMLWGKCDSSFFTKPQQILIVKYFPIWCKFKVFSQLFFRLLGVRTGGEEKTHSKVLFLLKVLKLVKSSHNFLFL